MNQRLSIIFFLLCSFYSATSYADVFKLMNPKTIEVYLITADVGSGLEKRYGHTILRIHNKENNRNYLLNWGTFDFSQPYYVPRFLKGQLRYWVSVSDYKRTIHYYSTYEDRTLYEDKIHLSTSQKEKLLQILHEKLKPENKYFWYHFFYNNCSTIPRDILDEVLNGAISQKFKQAPVEKTLRDYVRKDLNEWSIVSFFLDIILNRDVDGPINVWTEMFHPLVLQKYLQEMPQIDEEGKPIEAIKLLSDFQVLYKGGDYPPSPLNFFVITFIVGLLGLILILFLHKKSKTNAYRLLSLMLFAWGTLYGSFHGLVLLAGWIFSNHEMLYHNANLLLFWPTDVIFLYWSYKFFRYKDTFEIGNKGRYYLYAHLISGFLLAVLFFTGFLEQNVSNVVYYLFPITTLYWVLLLQKQKLSSFSK